MLHQGKDGKNYVLQILYKKRDYFLSADSKQQLQDWLDIIEAALKTYNILTEIEQVFLFFFLLFVNFFL